MKNQEEKIKPMLGMKINGKIYDYKIFQSLELLAKTYSQRKTAKELGISHSVLNRRVKNAEEKIGEKLVESFGSGSELTEKGIELLNIYYKYKNRLEDKEEVIIAGGYISTNLIQSLTHDLPFKILVYSSDNESAYKLAKQNLLDILALDDPLLAFKNDLNFTAIAYDHLVLVGPVNSKKSIRNINDLKNMNFIGVKGTAQRLAWDTLRQNNVEFNIKKEVKSQFDAFKIVKNSDNLYTFLNGSYFNGNDILKHETRHAISLIQCDDSKNEIYDIMEYLLIDGQKQIKKKGFVPINSCQRRF